MTFVVFITFDFRPNGDKNNLSDTSTILFRKMFVLVCALKSHNRLPL